MAHWIVEDRIGERRAGLIEDGRLVEMAIEWDDDPTLRVGAIVAARLDRRADATGRGRASLLLSGEAVMLRPVPPGLTEGSRLLVEIEREALPEDGRTKPARARPAAAETVERDGPDLLARLMAGPVPVDCDSPGGTLDALGWQEALEEAESGIVARPEVLLRISPTPAMTLIDVDGALAPTPLALAGAREAGLAIRRFGLAGSIGLDLPTLPDRAARQAAAAAMDAALPQPFERTAVNGFGFLQIVRRRERRSVVERLRGDPAGAAARALLAQAIRTTGAGPVTLVGHPQVIERIAARPSWCDAVAAAVGATLALRPDRALAISAGYASRAAP